MPPSASPRVTRVLAVASVLTLAGGLAAAYQLEIRADRAPSFDTGGAFLGSLPAAGEGGRPYPYGDASSATGATSATSATTAAAPSARGAATPTTTAGTSPTAGSPETPLDAAPEATTPTTAAASLPVPATGAYTYAVTGTESASGFGSRSFPASASLVIHGDASVPAGSLVHDLRLSGQHEERAVVAYAPTGAAFTYEAGSVTFGPGTQTSQGSYDPPMVQIPWPLAEGATATGTSAARDGGGAVTRTEQWTTTVVGREVLEVLGQPRETWVVDIQRNTVGGGAERVDRFRRYWYDQQLGMWVRWHERFHGERDMLVTFTFDSEYTATLASFAPS